MTLSRRWFTPRNLSIALVLFLFVYGPPLRILPLNVSTLLGVLAWGFLLRDPRPLAHLREFGREIGLLVLVLVYSTVVSVFGGDMGFFYNGFILLFANIPFCIWISSLILKRQDPRELRPAKGLIDLLVLIGLVSAVLSVVLATFPDIGEFVKFQILKYDDVLMEFQSHRAFGFSDELLFSYSLVQGLIVVFILKTYGIRLWSVLASLLLFASIALNARIGFVMVAFIPFTFRWTGKRVLSLSLIVALALLVSSYFDTELLGTMGNQVAYFGREMGGLLTGDTKDSIFQALFSDMLFIPHHGWQFLLGSGENVFFSGVRNSDSGYVILLGYGGVALLTLVVLFLAVCMLRALTQKRNRFFISVLVATFLVANAKGLFFAPKPGMRLFLLMYVFLVVADKLRAKRARAGERPASADWEPAALPQ